MAQAEYTDPNAPSKRRAAQVKAQAQANITARNTPPSGPAGAQQFQQRIASTKATISGGIADGIGDAATAQARQAAPRLTPEEIASFDRQSQGRFSQSNPQAAARPAPGAVPGATTRVVSPAQLTLHEAESLNRQSQGRFSQQHPDAPQRGVTGDAARVRPMPQLGDGVATPAPAAATPAPVNAGATARKPMGRGKSLGTAAALLTGLYAAAESTGRSTADYRRSFGMDPKSPDGLTGLAADVGTRIAGTARDTAYGLVDGLVIAPGNAMGRIAQGFGADPNGALGREAPYLSDGVYGPQAQPPAKPDFSNVTSGSGTVQGRGSGGGGQSPDDVLGTFNGRTITRGESDALSAKLPTASGPVAFGPNGSYAAATGGATRAMPALGEGLVDAPRAPQGQGLGASIGTGGNDTDARMKTLSDTSTATGRMYQQLLTDKTPTGKRMAAQFAAEYLGASTAERGQDKDLQRTLHNDDTVLQRGREDNATQLEAERIRERGNRRQPQLVFNDDGSVGQIADGVLSSVKNEDGTPAKVASRKAQGNPQSALQTLKAQEELLAARLGPRENYADEAEYAAARDAEMAKLMQELGLTE